MNFVAYANAWSKSEVTQGRMMIGIGVVLLVVLYNIIRSQNDLLKGMLIPLGLMVIVLIGYGSYIIYSRPAHVKASIILFEKSESEAIEKEKLKHINDNKAGKSLMKFVYPTLMILSTILLLIFSNPYYKGMALGFVLLFISTFIIDYGFVSRSDAFISFLNNL